MNRPEDIIIRRVLNNRGTTRDAKRVAAWLGTSEGQEWLKHEMENYAGDIDAGLVPMLQDADMDVILERILKRIRRRRFLHISLGIAAALIPILVVGGFWLNINNRMGGVLSNSSGNETITVARGDIETLVFQDGTRVKLNAGSSLTYPHYFGLKDRTVFLSGEAFFDVTGNSARPFIVSIDNKYKVEVTGTRFNVSAYSFSPLIDVSLYEGTVSFHSGNDKIHISPNQRLSFDKSTGKGSLTALSSSAEDIPWINNILVFKDTPIKEVVQALVMRYDVDIQLGASVPQQITYSFTTDSGDTVDDVLSDMMKLSPIVVTKSNDGKYVIARKR